jgi:hypothetical protein
MTRICAWLAISRNSSLNVDITAVETFSPSSNLLVVATDAGTGVVVPIEHHDLAGWVGTGGPPEAPGDARRTSSHLLVRAEPLA